MMRVPRNSPSINLDPTNHKFSEAKDVSLAYLLDIQNNAQHKKKNNQ